jgi:L-fuconolactonase
VDIAAVAAHPSVVCKMSGMATEASPDWTASHLKPYVDHLLEVFGPGRILWGSDWPVLNLAGDYSRWIGRPIRCFEICESMSGMRSWAAMRPRFTCASGGAAKLFPARA